MVCEEIEFIRRNSISEDEYDIYVKWSIKLFHSITSYRGGDIHALPLREFLDFWILPLHQLLKDKDCEADIEELDIIIDWWSRKRRYKYIPKKGIFDSRGFHSRYIQIYEAYSREGRFNRNNNF